MRIPKGSIDPKKHKVQIRHGEGFETIDNDDKRFVLIVNQGEYDEIIFAKLNETETMDGKFIHQVSVMPKTVAEMAKNKSETKNSAKDSAKSEVEVKTNK
jgi:hypothetical protein